MQLPFTFTTGEAFLYDTAPSVGPPEPCSAPKQRKLDNCSVSPNSMLGCMMNQDQSLYHNNNTVTSLDDLAFKDSHATLSVPGDVWADAALKNMTGSLMKPDSMVQDMMDTLQQILGENELRDSLEVEPEELKSWESTLLKLSSSCDMSDDLCDILSNDVLNFVEEQLQRDGTFATPELMEQIPPCVELQSQAQQAFSWPCEPQDQDLLSQVGAPVSGTMKLTHIDLPPMSSAAFNSPTLQLINFQQSSGLQLDQPGLEDSSSASSSLGAFPLRRPAANQNHCHQMPQPIQNQEPNPVFSVQTNQWGSGSRQVHSVDPFADHPPHQRGFGANPQASGCLQAHFGLREENSDHQNQTWSLDHQHSSDGTQQVVGSCLSQTNPLGGAVTIQNSINGRSPHTFCAPFAAQQGGKSSTCMFSTVGPSCQRLNPTGTQITPQSSCLYGDLPGGGAVPGMTSVLNPDEMALTCKSSLALRPEDLLVHPQQYLNVSEYHTQVKLRSGDPVHSFLPDANCFMLKAGIRYKIIRVCEVLNRSHSQNL